MHIERSSRRFAAALVAGLLLLGAAACSSDGGDDATTVGDAVDDLTVDDVDTDETPEDDGEADGSDDEGAGGDESTGGDGGVTASYEPARASLSIDDIDSACDHVPVSEVEDVTGASDLSADGIDIPGMDLQCEYENDDGSVWVQIAYTVVDDDVDLLAEFDGIPTVAWYESIDDLGEQAIVLGGPMGSAQVDIVDGDLRVMANTIVGGDAAASQQAAFDLAIRGIGG